MRRTWRIRSEASRKNPRFASGKKKSAMISLSSLYKGREAASTVQMPYRNADRDYLLKPLDCFKITAVDSPRCRELRAPFGWFLVAVTKIFMLTTNHWSLNYLTSILQLCEWKLRKWKNFTFVAAFFKF